MATPLLVHIEALAPAEREALASRWGAPSVIPRHLERFLLGPVQVRQRLDGLSEHALEELIGLLEASRPGVPVSQLSEIAVFELEEALLVSRPPSVPHLVFIPDEVAVVALERLTASPSRLRLLLARLDGPRVEAMADAVEAAGGAPEPGGSDHGPSPAAHARVAAVLMDVCRLSRLVRGLPVEVSGFLWDLVDDGGHLPAAGAMRASGQEAVDALASLGLLWLSGEDLRIPAEVLRGLLELRLGVQVSDLDDVVAQLQRSGTQDNVLMFPTASGRLLGEIAEVLHARGALPLEELGGALGLADDPDVAEALIDLAGACGLVRRRGRRCAAGPVVRIERRRQWWQGLTEDQRVDHVVSRLVDEGVESFERPVAALLTDEVIAEIDGLDDDELSGWAALPPHVMADMEFGHVDRAGQSRARSLLRLALQRMFARLAPGRLYPLDRVTEACERVAAAARTWTRLVGQLYAPTLATPSAEAATDAVVGYLEAVAVPLGWAMIEEGPERAEAPAPAAPEPPSDAATLPLFAMEPEAPVVAAPAEPTSASSGGKAALRLMRAWPDLPRDCVEPVLAEAGRHRRLVSRLLGLQAHRRSSDAVTLDAARTGEFVSAVGAEVGLREQLRAFCSWLDEPAWLEAARLLSTHLELHADPDTLSEVDAAPVLALLTRVMSGPRKDRDRPGLRRLFNALSALSRWSGEVGVELGFDPDALRERLEGPSLRAESADSAIRHFQRRVPPADLLRFRPNLTFKGPVRLLHVDHVQARAKVIPTEASRAGWANEWVVRLDPRPLLLLKPGDVLDVKLVRYGHQCWITSLRSVLPPELLGDASSGSWRRSPSSGA